MPHLDEHLLEKAKSFVEALKRDKPELTFQRTSKILLASAYYIVSVQEGKPISSLEIAKIFGVSSNQVRGYLKILGYGFDFGRAKRERNAYDIYAEIIANEGRTVTKLIYDIHITHSELKKHLKKLIETDLIIKRREGSHEIYDSTDRGRLYLKRYMRMKELLSRQD